MRLFFKGLLWISLCLPVSVSVSCSSDDEAEPEEAPIDDSMCNASLYTPQIIAIKQIDVENSACKDKVTKLAAHLMTNMDAVKGAAAAMVSYFKSPACKKISEKFLIPAAAAYTVYNNIEKCTQDSDPTAAATAQMVRDQLNAAGWNELLTLAKYLSDADAQAASGQGSADSSAQPSAQ